MLYIWNKSNYKNINNYCKKNNKYLSTNKIKCNNYKNKSIIKDLFMKKQKNKKKHTLYIEINQNKCKILYN